MGNFRMHYIHSNACAARSEDLRACGSLSVGACLDARMFISACLAKGNVSQLRGQRESLDQRHRRGTKRPCVRKVLLSQQRTAPQRQSAFSSSNRFLMLGELRADTLWTDASLEAVSKGGVGRIGRWLPDPPQADRRVRCQAFARRSDEAIGVWPDLGHLSYHRLPDVERRPEGTTRDRSVRLDNELDTVPTRQSRSEVPVMRRFELRLSHLDVEHSRHREVGSWRARQWFTSIATHGLLLFVRVRA